MCPSYLNFLNNMGSMIIIIFFIQVFSGVVLSFFYNISNPFETGNNISTTSKSLIRWWHVNCVSFFFLFLYSHLLRGVVQSSFSKSFLWITGFLLLVLVQLEAFLGYTLPWGQMSYWAVTVVTSFMSVIPMIGNYLVDWVISSFSPGVLVLQFFFSLHILIPFIILLFIVLHMILLHKYGSSGYLSFSNSSSFFYFLLKDCLNFVFLLFLLFYFSPWKFFEALNFVEANSFVSPLHIKPEWYFLFLYAVLRSIPHKFSGVLFMVLMLLVILLMSMSSKFYQSYFNFYLMFLFILSFYGLTMIGSLAVSDYLNLFAMIFMMIYFSCMFFMFY